MYRSGDNFKNRKNRSLIRRIPVTVANQTNRTSAVGSGAIGQEVPFLFPITFTSDLLVKKRVTATGVETTLDETTNYTVSISGDTGGTLTTVTAIETTEQIHIIRNTPRTQSLDLEQGGSFNAENVEDALDKNTKLIIESHDKIVNKAITFPETDDSALTTILPSSVDGASKVVARDSSGNITMIDAVPEGSVAFSTFGTNMAEAANALAGKAVINLDHIFDIRDYGAETSESATANATAIQAALDAVGTAGGGAIFIPIGEFDYNTTLTMSTITGIVGMGPQASILNFTATNGTNAIECEGTGDDLSTGVPKQWCWMKEVAVKGNASSGHGIVFDIARYCIFFNVFSLSHGGDCWHIGSPPVAASYLSTIGRIILINCHSSGGTNSVYAAGGDISIIGKGGFSGSSAIGIILEDIRISLIDGINGGSGGAGASHGIEIRTSAGNTTNQFGLHTINIKNVHWEQLESGDSFVNVNIGGTTKFSKFSVRDCNYSGSDADGITMAGSVRGILIDGNYMKSNAGTGITIGPSCEDINIGPNFWLYGVNISDSSAAGELTFRGGIRDIRGDLDTWTQQFVCNENQTVCNENVIVTN